MGVNKRAGTLYLKINGEIQDAKGNFTYRPSVPKRSAINGADRVHGFKEEVQEPYIEGEITDKGTLDIEKLFTTEDATVTLELANGKTFILREAWYAGEATVQTQEGNIAIRFEGMDGEEVA